MRLFKTCAEYYGIDEHTAEQLHAAMDSAARQFWAYPGRVWQQEFEGVWLLDHGFVDASIKAFENLRWDQEHE